MIYRFFFAFTLALISIQSLSADLVITEIMQNPSAVNDADGEWFEIFNSGPNTIDLNGFTISDAGSDSFTVGVSLVAQPGDYLVFGNNANFSTNGGVTVDFEYPTFFLSNGADELFLEDASSNLLDSVEWDGGTSFPDPNGASMVLNGSNPSIDNNVGSNWATSTTAFGLGDFGTPGSGSFVAVPEPSAFLFGTLICGVLGAKYSRKRDRS